MKVDEFKIPIYSVSVDVVHVEVTATKEGRIIEMKTVKKFLKEKHVCKHIIREICCNIRLRSFDGGIINFCKSTRKIVLLFYPFKDKRLEVIGHEKRHIEDFILEHFNIDDIESAALLSGFLTTKLFK